MNGGTTTAGDDRAQSARPVAPEPAATPQLVQVLASLDQRLQGVENWATNLTVSNDLFNLNRELEKAKTVQNRSAVRPTEKSPSN